MVKGDAGIACLEPVTISPKEDRLSMVARSLRPDVQRKTVLSLSDIALLQEVTDDARLGLSVWLAR